MSDAEALDFAREAIVTMLKIGVPVMMIGLAVGLVIALLQALTQIQEMTLTFVPKILVIFVSLIVLLPFMLETMRTFMEGIADRIIGLGAG